MSLRSAKYVNNNTEAHFKESNKEHDKDHVGETSEGHGRDQGEEAREEAHQPRGAAPRPDERLSIDCSAGIGQHCTL